MSVIINGTSGIIGAINSMTAQNSTSGTSIDFTSIPAGVKRVTVMFTGVSTSGTSSILIQLGSGSVQSTGYASTCSTFSGTGSNSTAGYIVNNNIAAANTHSGNVVLTLLTSNVWTSSGVVFPSTTAQSGCGSAGTGSISGTIDRVRITTVNGTDTFDAGTINVLYE